MSVPRVPSVLDLRAHVRAGFRFRDDLSVSEARAVWSQVRQGVGLQATCPDLLGDGQISKTNKNKVRTFTLSLSQASTSGVVNTCPWSTADCRAVCVAQNGNGAYDSVKLGRKARTVLLADHPAAFFRLLVDELQRADARASRQGVPVAVRMNTYSDIPWSTWVPELFGLFPSVVFYDYTKNPRAVELDNYTLTHSWTARMGDPSPLLAAGKNVAIVSTARKGDAVPTTFQGWPVVDGDATDYRPDDGRGVVVHLTSKGRATKLVPGKFVRPVEDFQ